MACKGNPPPDKLTQWRPLSSLEVNPLMQTIPHFSVESGIDVWGDKSSWLGKSLSCATTVCSRREAKGPCHVLLEELSACVQGFADHLNDLAGGVAHLGLYLVSGCEQAVTDSRETCLHIRLEGIIRLLH